jgi:hypothetical protein
MYDEEENQELISPRDLPIYKKGEEILEVVNNIYQLIPEENKHLHYIKEMMLSDAMQLTVKITAAEAGGL